MTSYRLWIRHIFRGLCWELFYTVYRVSECSPTSLHLKVFCVVHNKCLTVRADSSPLLSAKFLTDNICKCSLWWRIACFMCRFKSWCFMWQNMQTTNYEGKIGSNRQLIANVVLVSLKNLLFDCEIERQSARQNAKSKYTMYCISFPITNLLIAHQVHILYVI